MALSGKTLLLKVSFALPKRAIQFGLIAPQKVLKALWQFRDATVTKNPNWSLDEHDRCLNQLMLAIRADLGVSPKDDPNTFDFRLWESGVNR